MQNELRPSSKECLLMKRVSLGFDKKDKEILQKKLSKSARLQQITAITALMTRCAYHKVTKKG